MLGWSALALTNQATDYVARFETKDEHKQDIEQKVELFKKDVRIAILENNKVLLDELEKRTKH